MALVDDFPRGQSSNGNNTANPNSQEFLDYLKSIDDSLKQILKDGQNISAANARNAMPRREDFRGRRSTNGWGPNSYDMRNAPGRRRRNVRSSVDSVTDEFLDGLKDSLLDSVVGSEFKREIRGMVGDFADMLGVSIQDIPKKLGQELGKHLLEKFKDTKTGSSVFQKVEDAKKNSTEWVRNKFNEGVDRYNREHPGQPDIPGLGQRRNNIHPDPGQPAAEAVNNAAGQAASNVGQVSDFNQELFSRLLELSVETMNVHADVVNLYAAKEDLREEREQEERQERRENRTEDERRNLPERSETSQQDIPDQVSDLTDTISDLSNSSETSFGDVAPDVAESALSSGEGSAIEAAAESGMAETAAAEGAGMAAETGAMAGAAEGAGAALAGLGEVAAAACPYILIAVAAIIVVTKLIEACGPAIEGTKKMLNEMQRAGNRYNESRKKAVEEEKKRLEADVKTLIETPFEILRKAAEEMYSVWDQNLRKINATQGYDKAELQELIGSYAERLRNEGLSDVVSSSDIASELASVLDAGLSGKVAEEFAYQATKLNAEIPTEDFLQYASSYAALAANQIRLGKSQEDAIAYANAQLEAFASNVLYASRQISGGFTSGLKNAQSLFEQSVEIAQASRIGDPSQISGVLTSVAAITGAIAPDLATSMTDAIYKAATGGNSSEIVALRSLAGINASNTEFLKVLATNPQKVFAALFTKLAEYQNMSQSNYMEVAEGLSSIFGLSMDAFARIDFNYLAQAVASMRVSDDALNENLAQLSSGQTTLTAEQLKTREINKYMIENGLSYVLDNEAARAIQQHMWDEQLALQMQEATYAVDLQGAALDFLEGIRETIYNIMKILNPLMWFSELADLIGTAQEGYAQQADIVKVLEMGKVGEGNTRSLYQLTTRGQLLDVVDDLVTMMGGVSSYGAARARRIAGRDITRLFTSPLFGSMSLLSDAVSLVTNASLNAASQRSYSNREFDSNYAWGTIGKSVAAQISAAMPKSNLISAVASSNMSETNVSQNVASNKLNQMLEDSYMVDEFINKGKSYDSWKKSAVNFGIADFDAALEAAGYTEQQLKNRFEAKQTEEGAKEVAARDADEQDFRDKGRQFWIDEREFTRQIVEELFPAANSKLDSIITLFEDWHTKWDEFRDYFNWHNFYDDWNSVYLNGNKGWLEFFTKFKSYFIDHEAYNNSYSIQAVQEVQRKERSGKDEAVQKLAETLSKNITDLSDPTMQTNALLSQILIQVLAIVEQNNKTAGTITFADAMSALSLGGTTAATTTETT